MTPIEQQALALINEVALERDCIQIIGLDRKYRFTDEAICRLIERHEAFKQEVSEACGLVDMMIGQVFFSEKGNARHVLSRFILPGPVDPLVEAMEQAGWRNSEGTDGLRDLANDLHKALAARGLEITEKKP